MMCMKECVILLLFLVACAQLTPTASEGSCPTLAVWNGSACCQDLDSNSICDNRDEAVLSRIASMPVEKRNPPTPAAAPKIVRKPTIITESLEKVKSIASYEYVINNYHYFVAGSRITIYLPELINIGKMVSANQTYAALINVITFDRFARTAVGECVKPKEFIKYAVDSPCDKLQGMTFELNYKDYATFKTPEDILDEFKLEYPFEVLEKQHVGSRLATLAVFRRNRQNQSLLWIDPINGLPRKYQRIENEKPVETVEFLDLFVNNGGHQNKRA